MKSTLSLALLLAGCASAPPASSPPAPAPAPSPVAAAPAPKAPKAPVALEEYFKIGRVGVQASISYDDKWVVFAADTGGRMDLWASPVAGGPAKQLTHVEGFLGSFELSPTSDHLVYLADQGGTELMHLFLTNANGDAAKDLTADDPKTARAELLGWTEDGKAILYKSNRRDEKAMDLYEYDLKSGKSKLLLAGDGKLEVNIASRDGKRFILVETLSDVNFNLYLWDRGMKAPLLITPHQGEVAYGPTGFSKDGKTLYFVSDEKGELTELYEMDLATKKSTPKLKGDGDVEDAQVSRGGRYFVTNINIDGLATITLTDLKTKQAVELPGATAQRAILPAAFSKSDRYVAAAVLTDSEPRNIVLIDLVKKTSTSLVQLLPESLRNQPMVTGRSVRIKSFDGREVPAFLYSPAGPGPFPAEIDVHGGPTAQSRRSFDAWRQYQVSKGIAVLVPNVRGSTGYGKTYTKLDNLDLGGGPLEDIVACKRWLVKEANVDEQRVVVLGGSYGGYMALAAATFKPKEFAANVDYFGVSDLKSLVESFPAYWATYATYIHQKFGDPKNPAHAKYQHDRSPLNFLDQVERPLLVVQGENDVRVKKDQSDRAVEKLRARKVPVHYLVIPGEGHGFSKNENRLAAFQVTDRFLDRYLFGDTSVEVIAGER